MTVQTTSPDLAKSFAVLFDSYGFDFLAYMTENNLTVEDFTGDKAAMQEDNLVTFIETKKCSQALRLLIDSTFRRQFHTTLLKLHIAKIATFSPHDVAAFICQQLPINEECHAESIQQMATDETLALPGLCIDETAHVA